MKTRKQAWTARGFTRFELLVVLGVTALLGAVVLPGAANTKARYDKIACMNNLRQIGVAFHVWGADHDDQVPLRVSPAQGGMKGHPMAGYAWFSFYGLSNELASPKVLCCPADAQKSRSTRWSQLAQSQSRANDFVSYVVGPDSMTYLPSSIVSGDRNLIGDGTGNCTAGISSVFQASTRPANRLAWINSIHGTEGNVLLNNGQVVDTTTDSLRYLLSQGHSDLNGSLHLVMP